MSHDALPRTPSPVTLNASIDTPVGETLTYAGSAVLLGQALRDVIAERLAQVDQHGHTLQADQFYEPDELSLAAACYLETAIDQVTSTRPGGSDVSRHDLLTWPWTPDSWRPRDQRTNLVKAAALIWAALDYIDHLPRDANDDRIAA